MPYSSLTWSHSSSTQQLDLLQVYIPAISAQDRTGGRRKGRMAQEVELKFLIESGGLPMLDALPVIGKRLRRAPRKHIETTYFDTSDRRFADNGFALRVRKQDKSALLSIKQSGSLGSGREEWERPIKDDEPNRDNMSGSPAAPLLKKNGNGSDLAPLYT